MTMIFKFLLYFRGFGAPLSPLSWVEKSITDLTPDGNPADRAKVLMGLNFYGIKYGDTLGFKPIINHEYVCGNYTNLICHLLRLSADRQSFNSIYHESNVMLYTCHVAIMVFT